MCRISVAPFPPPKPVMAVAVMYRLSEANKANAVRTIPSLAFGGRASSFPRNSPFRQVAHFSIRIFIFPICAYLSMLLMSLFSNTVKPSMVKPFGLSSERLAFRRRQEVTRLRSVTLLSRINIWRAYVRAS